MSMGEGGGKILNRYLNFFHSELKTYRSPSASLILHIFIPLWSL